MLPGERLEAILDYINQHHSATVVELSDKFCVGDTSIRRDLTKLQRGGFIRKTYGGAVLFPANNDVLALEARQRIEETEKRTMAQKAASLINDGDVVFLDSSSTSLSMIPFLKVFNSLSVVTHGIQTAVNLLPMSHIKVYLAGGLIKSNLQSTSGVFTCGMFGAMRADKCFISPRAVHRSLGVYCTNEEEMAVRRAMMEHSSSVILLCSVNKLDQSSQFKLCELKEIKTIVCEKDPGREWHGIFSENKIELL